MANPLTWNDVVWRLLCTVIAGALIGINRGEHGRPAGLRTTLLVCLAASLSMLQVNFLLTLHGKPADSFIVMDLMRLPLGILSGMGFIGAGAILRREKLIVGVTTAATLWFVTVIGLCMGGGQIGLGFAGLILGSGILWLLKPVERLWKRDYEADLQILLMSGAPAEAQITQAIRASGCCITSLAVGYEGTTAPRELKYHVKWSAPENEVQPPRCVEELAGQPGVLKVSWIP